MKLWVGVTDEGWFNYLRARNPDEVNFWQPSGGREFRVLQPGEPFLFKLHSPKNYIVGGGFFVRYRLYHVLSHRRLLGERMASALMMNSSLASGGIACEAGMPRKI